MGSWAPPDGAAPRDNRRRDGRIRWVAHVPGWSPGRAGTPRERPYDGPPSYPAPPRWGLPNIIWRPPTAIPGTTSGRREPVESTRTVGAFAAAMLLLTAVLAALAGVALLWRYLLLVVSRDDAVDAHVLLASDLAVWTLTFMTWLVAAATVYAAAWWLLVAYPAAARHAGADPPRPAVAAFARVFAPWVLLAASVAGLVVLARSLPVTRMVVETVGPELVIVVVAVAAVFAGPVVAELEHMAMKRPPRQRPKPSRLVIAWWLVWAANPVFAVLTIRSRLMDGLQAQADAVLLGAITDFAAAASAVLTFLVIRRVVRLLVPDMPAKLRKLRVVAVRGAPDVPLREARPAGARR